MRRPNSLRACAPFLILTPVAVFVAQWHPEIAIFACRHAALLCGCTTTGPAQARAAEPLEHATTLDDAGRACRADELQSIELRVETDVSRYVGHAYIKTPKRSVGFYTDVTDLGLTDYLSPFAPAVPGVTKDDAGRHYDRVTRFRVAPQTLRLLEESIDAHATEHYQLGNWQGGRNCATWTTDRLRDAGLTPPQGDRPNKLAPQMEAVEPPTDE